MWLGVEVSYRDTRNHTYRQQQFTRKPRTVEIGFNFLVQQAQNNNPLISLICLLEESRKKR